MSAPSYSQVPPSDFQTVNTSYPPQQPYPAPQPDEKTRFAPGVQEYSPPQGDLLTAATPQTAFQRGVFRLRTLSHKFWLLEAFASVLSLALFAAIIGVLAWYDNAEYGSASNGQQNPTKRPTIFPVLAILGVIMRAAMLLPVATAIGQLKWGWFRTPRRLLDMERFDEAARGVLGSAKLMWTLKFRNAATVGAALTILALPLDALIQSSVLIPSTFIPNKMVYTVHNKNITETTTMPRSTWYNESQIMQTEDRLYPDTSLMNALRFGQSYSNGLGDLFSTVMIVDCPTGTCYFPKSQTLAINGTCADRTKEIVNHPAKGNSYAYQSLPGTNLTFYPNGDAEHEAQLIATRSYADYDHDQYIIDLFGAEFLGLIVRTAIMFQGPGNATLAYECALSWTVRTAEEYVNATSEYQLDATLDPVPFTVSYLPTKFNWWSLEPERCYVQGKEVHKSNDTFYQDNCIFAVGSGAGKGLEIMLLDPEDGFMGDSWQYGPKNFTRTNPFVTNLESARSWDKVEDVTEAINIMWGNLAVISSFTVRHTKSLLINQDEAQYLTTEGTVWRGIFYYKIDWPRLGLPAFVVGFAAFFVLFTAITTRKEYAWRRSALPLLFHGIEDRERVALGDVRSFLTMQDVAEKLHVKLEEHVDANGARFTTQHGS